MYPINLILDGCPCVVIGGGEVAARKAVGLLEAEAEVTVISPRLCEKLQGLLAEGRIKWRQKEYENGDLEGFSLAITATDDEMINKASAEEAKARKILINVVDRLALCDFAMPAIIRRGDLLVTSSTNGKSPAMARELKRELSAFLDKGYAPFIENLSRLRELAMEKIPTFRQREDFWRQALNEDILKLVCAGKVEEAEARIRDAIGSFRA